jgi:hypothetical protein
VLDLILVYIVPYVLHDIPQFIVIRAPWLNLSTTPVRNCWYKYTAPHIAILTAIGKIVILIPVVDTGAIAF